MENTIKNFTDETKGAWGHATETAALYLSGNHYQNDRDWVIETLNESANILVADIENVVNKYGIEAAKKNASILERIKCSLWYLADIKDFEEPLDYDLDLSNSSLGLVFLFNNPIDNCHVWGFNEFYKFICNLEEEN